MCFVYTNRRRETCTDKLLAVAKKVALSSDVTFKPEWKSEFTLHKIVCAVFGHCNLSC
jgi:hypothetical protein